MNLTDFSFSVQNIRIHLGINPWDYHLTTLLSLQNPSQDEVLSLELGYDNSRPGFIADTGIFANFGYRFPLSETRILDIRAGLFSLDAATDGRDDIALQLKTTLETQDRLELNHDFYNLDSETELKLFTLRQQTDLFLSAQTKIGLNQLEKDQFGFGIKGWKLDVYAITNPIVFVSGSRLYTDLQYFLPLEPGTLAFRFVTGHHPKLVGGLEAQANFSGMIFGSYRYSLPLRISYLEELGIAFRRLSFSPRLGVYADLGLSVSSDLAVSLDVLSFDRSPLSVFALVGYESIRGFYFQGGVSLGY